MGAPDHPARAKMMAALQASGGAQNIVDRAIAYFAPATAVRRLASRGMLALGGGYTGARIDKASLNRWMPTAGSPNSDIIRDLPQLRSRSRDQMRNAPIAVGAMETTIGHVVGTGLAMVPAIDAVFLGLSQEQADAWRAETRRRWEQWCCSVDCDAARQLNFYGLQELAFRSTLESGDAFVVTPRLERAGRGAQLALQLLEADRVSNPDRKPNTATLVDGIEVDGDTGEALACHVSRFHPGDSQMGTNTWRRIALRGESGRRNVLHLFKPLRPGQVRGVPWISPILEPLKQLQRFTDAELKAAVDSAIFSVFVKMDPDAFQDLFDEDAQGAIVESASQWSGEMESGKAVNLLPGEEIQSPAPGRPNPAFDPFVQAILRQIGVALQLPYEVLTMHYQSSYSAARAALLMAWKFFRARRDWLATYMCQPVYELWLSEQVAEGQIGAPGFFASPITRAAWCGAAWIGDGPGSIDPQKEVTAAQKRVDMGISTLAAESILHDGVDWESKHAQRMREVTARRDGGLDGSSQADATGEIAQEDDPTDGLPMKPNSTETLFKALAALASRPISLLVRMPPAPAPVQPPAPAPTSITVYPPAPAQMVVQQRGPDRQVHKRDPETGELVETINIYDKPSGTA